MSGHDVADLLAREQTERELQARLPEAGARKGVVLEALARKRRREAADE